MSDLNDIAGNVGDGLWLSRIAKLQLWIAAFTIIVSAIVAFMMIPIIKKKAQLEDQVSQLKEEQTKLHRDLEETQNKLNRYTSALKLPASDVKSLVDRGVVNRNTDSQNWSTIAEQSLKAGDELKHFQSLPKDTKRRNRVTIRYYIRASDHGGVTEAMMCLQKDYGFRVVPNNIKKEPNTLTNAIWLNNPNVQEDDIKLVAYYLILYGFEVKYVGPPSSKPEEVSRKVPETVVVVAEPKAEKEHALTVEEVRNLSLGSMKTGTSRLN